MSHVITVGDLVRWSLFVAFLCSLSGIVVIWLYTLAEGFSDSYSDSQLPAWVFWSAHLVPIAIGVAWWMT